MEKASLCCFMWRACRKPSQCLSFPIPDQWPVLSGQSKPWLQNFLALRPAEASPVECTPVYGVWASFLILLAVNTAWSEVTSPLFLSSASPGTLSRKENTKLCFSQESCSLLFPVSGLCQWHKLMLSQNLSSRFSSGILEAELSFILEA